MCKIKQSVSATLLAGLLVLAAGVARGQVTCETCPGDAEATAVGAGLTITRANGTLVAPNSAVGACETLNVLGSVAYQPRVLISIPEPPFSREVVGSGFFGGTGRISVNNPNPLGPFNVTPADMATFRVGPAPCADATLKGMNNLPYTITAADVAAGTITFTFTYADGRSLLGNCTLEVGATAQFTAQVVGLPSCAIAPATQEVCAGATATFTASSTGPAAGAPHTFTWTGPGGFTATGATITVGTGGTYVATITDRFGCTSTCTAVLIVNPNPQCTIAPALAEVCEGSPATTFTVNITSGTAPFTVTWTGPGGFTATGNSITRPSIEANEGTYVANVVDSKGCVTSCTAQLIVNPNPTCVIQPQSLSLCTGVQGSLTVVPSGGTAPYTVSWTRNGSAFDGANLTITVVGPAAGTTDTYVARVVDSKGCATTCQATVIGIQCAPLLNVEKLVACVLPGGACPASGYAKKKEKMEKT